MNWKELWMTLFGTTEWLGLNMGFWVALAAVLLIVILMNVLFWSMKPKTVLIKKTHKRSRGDTQIFVESPSCIFFQHNTTYCIFIIDLRYILCYYDIVFKFCVIPL